MNNGAGFWAFDWDAAVTDDERDRIFDIFVRNVHRWRLETPAVLFLEMSAPFGSLAGQGMIVGSPFLAMLLPGGVADVQKLSRILSQPDNIRRLVDRIQQGAEDAARG